MTSATRSKILVLHGYAQSAAILSKRMAVIRKACKDVDLVFVDAPITLSPVDIAASFSSAQELGAAEATETDPALTPRAWWKSNPQRTEAIGVEASLDLLRDMLQKDRYEGVFGFSQGAAMAAMLAALLERPEAYPPFLVDGKPPHPPLSFCVSVAGFRPPGTLSDAIFLPSYSTHTLHVLGRTDVIVVEERSQKLLDVSSNKRVEWHDGGHFIPSKANWRNFFRDYLLNPGDSVPSPSLSSSQPPSGATTPRTNAAL